MKKVSKRGTGEIWDVKGQDVPGGRYTRSLRKGLTRVADEERQSVVKERRAALDRIRASASAAEDPSDRDALWNLIPEIGLSGYPTWADVVEARTSRSLVVLARRGELHAETDARRERDAQVSERRTCYHSVDEYLNWQEIEGFAEDTRATASSVLRRMLTLQDRYGSRIGSARVAALTRSAGRDVLDMLSESQRMNGRVSISTRAKNRKILRAWFNWELMREGERAEDQRRQALFTVNVFDASGSGYSAPTKDARARVEDRQTRRFNPDEMERLVAAADEPWRWIITIACGLGLRPGELIHVRWLEDVRPLPDRNGYNVLLNGDRGRDLRCGCRQCKSRRGWAPKNGPRRYVLDRTYDRLGWISPICDAVDAALTLRRPSRGDFLCPDHDDWSRPWTNNKLNRALHELGERAHVVTGLNAHGGRTFHSFRHTCACEMLEAGITHPHAAYWIGDSLKEFMRTYGKPTDEAMARQIFGGTGRAR